MYEKILLTKNGRCAIGVYDPSHPDDLMVAGVYRARIEATKSRIQLDFGVCYPKEAREISDLFGLGLNPDAAIHLRVSPDDSGLLRDVMTSRNKHRNIAAIICGFAYIQLMSIILPPVARGVAFFMALPLREAVTTLPPAAPGYFGFWATAFIFATIPTLAAIGYMHNAIMGNLSMREHRRRLLKHEVVEV